MEGAGVRALVRREAAARRLVDDNPGLDVRIVDYLDRSAMTEALTGASSVLHLVGIIKESGMSRYEIAHEQTSQVLASVAAAVGVERLINLSIVGSAADSSNACLSSKGRADQILLDGPGYRPRSFAFRWFSAKGTTQVVLYSAGR